MRPISVKYLDILGKLLRSIIGDGEANTYAASKIAKIEQRPRSVGEILGVSATG